MKKSKVKKKLDFFKGLYIFGFVTVLVIFIIMLVSINDSGLERPEIVCSGLEKDVNGSILIYPEIIKIKNQIESGWNMRIEYLDGETTRVRGEEYDSEGVMCEMIVQACVEPRVYCVDLTMIIPVSYEDWEDWSGSALPDHGE